MLRMPILLLTIGALCINPVAYQSNDNEKAVNVQEVQEYKEITKKGHSLLLGDWVSLYGSIIEDEIGERVREKPRRLAFTVKQQYIVNDNTAVVMYKDTYDVVTEDGYMLLVGRDNANDVFVKAEEYDEIYNRKFVDVTLTSENIYDYIGAPVYIGDVLDEWNEKAYNLYLLSSPAFNNGLIMLSFKDVQYELIGANYAVTLYEPYPTVYSTGDAYFGGFGRALGQITYVRSQYVKSISEGQTITGQHARHIEFTDGFSYDFEVSLWPKSTTSLAEHLQY